MACLYGRGITCLSNHGTTEPRNTRNTRNTRPYGHGIPGRRHYCGALGARNIVCVFCVFSGPLSAAYSGWGAPRHHGIHGIHGRRHYCGALGSKKHRLCILCVQWSSIRNTLRQGGDHGIPARMGTESSCEWLIVNFTGSHAACSGCCWGIKR